MSEIDVQTTEFVERLKDAFDEMVVYKDLKKSNFDRFGKMVKTKVHDDNSFQVSVKVCTGPTFYRWVFGFGGLIKIVSPDEIVSQYVSMLQSEIERYSI